MAETAPDWQELHRQAHELQEEGAWEAAATALRAALRLRPGDAGLRRALALLGSRAALVGRLIDEGVALVAQDRIAEAEASFRAVLRQAPRSVVARGNLAALLLRRGRPEQALAAFDTALALAPGSLDAERVRADRATARLLLGDFAGGWADFEARWRLPGYREAAAAIAPPRWTGAEPLAGRRLLLWAEQGYGDTLQFVRYAPLAAARGATVLLRVPPALTRLLAGMPGVAEVHDMRAEPPPADLSCPLLSLPLAFGTTPDSIPAQVPYLAADPARVAAWRGRLAGLPGRRVGLVWAGGLHPDEPDAQLMDRRRSMPLSALAPLAGVEGVRFVSLQVGPASGQAPPPGLVLHDWTDELHDFADTAALVAALDLVIGVDTAVVHLAGALGRPVWLLNRFDTCWRWLLHRDDSPWYPTLRQFRQAAPGDWAGVAARVAAAL
ncbi:MAG: tetratricopeptide repeat protein [Rhodospirillales bacterium]|nr:tetratricopeptide repeat protein [Rhodospirillales bacterium]